MHAFVNERNLYRKKAKEVLYVILEKHHNYFILKYALHVISKL